MRIRKLRGRVCHAVWTAAACFSQWAFPCAFARHLRRGFAACLAWHSCPWHGGVLLFVAFSARAREQQDVAGVLAALSFFRRVALRLGRGSACR